MNAIDPGAAKSIFLAALDQPTSEERGAYLNDACAGDLPLRRRVEELLRGHEQVGSLLERPAIDPQQTACYEPVAEKPGMVIGRYKLLEQIGEGGMGVVFMAEQLQPVRRKVALKIVKPGMDSQQVIARFEAERQALALMDHPNIARVLDGGSTGERNPKSETRNPKQIQSPKSEVQNPAEPAVSDVRDSDLGIVSDFGFRHSDFSPGRPYFVMELVRGIPITEYCDQYHATLRQRLELFVQVCHAVQHAHQKGIIHRDIKPSNVMVTLHDGVPVPKVIDFGVAKAIGQELTERTLFTNFAQLVGTPLYMSPEQAALSGVDVDTRSDVYSLGVLLYEMLTGRTPFESERLREAGYDEMRRIIREEEPPRPSVRVTTLKAACTTDCPHCQGQPRDLVRTLRGELDWIVMKCLEKDRARRYESASALAADVERYLRDEPVVACPPSVLYRLRKFAWRRRSLILSATALAIAAIVLGSVAWSGYRRGVESKEYVGERLAVATALLQADDFPAAERELAEARARLGLVARGKGPLAEDVTRLAESLAAKTGAIERFDRFQKLRHRIHSEMYAVDRTILDQAQTHCRTALDLYQAMESDSWKQQSGFQHLGPERQATLEEGVVELLFVWARLELAKSDGQLPAELQAGHRRAVDAFSRIQTLQKPIPAMYLWIADAWEAVGEKQAATEARGKAEAIGPSAAMDYFVLGEHHARHGRLDEAVSSYWQALARQPDHYPSLVASGVALAELKRHEAAEAMLTGAIAANRNSTLAYVKRSDARWEQGKIALALADLQRAKELDPELVRALISRAGRYKFNLEFEKAVADYSEAIRLAPTNALAYAERGLLYAQNGDAHKGLADCDEAIRIDPQSYGAYCCRSGVYKLRGEIDKSLADAEKAIQLDPKGEWGYCERGQLHAAKGDWEKALADMNEMIRLAPEPRKDYAHRAAVYAMKGDYDKAIADFERAFDRPGQPIAKIGWYLFKSRAVAHFHLKQYDKALASIAKAVELEPGDSSSLTCLDLAKVAKCPDDRLRNGLLDLATETIRRAEDAKAGGRAVKFHGFKTVAPIYSARARLYGAFGQPEKALADFAKAIELEPDNPRVWTRRAGFYAERQQWDQAVADYEKAVQHQPHRPNDLNTVARFFATCPEPRVRKPDRAVQLAVKATQLAPGNGTYWNTLGVAQYRSRDHEAAVRSLTKAMELRAGGDAFDWFFLAMAQWQLDHKEEARRWYDKAVAWMEKNKPDDEQLLRFRAEAAELLGIPVKPPAAKELKKAR